MIGGDDDDEDDDDDDNDGDDDDDDNDNYATMTMMTTVMIMMTVMKIAPEPRQHNRQGGSQSNLCPCSDHTHPLVPQSWRNLMFDHRLQHILAQRTQSLATCNIHTLWH